MASFGVIAGDRAGRRQERLTEVHGRHDISVRRALAGAAELGEPDAAVEAGGGEVAPAEMSVMSNTSYNRQ